MVHLKAVMYVMYVRCMIHVVDSTCPCTYTVYLIEHRLLFACTYSTRAFGSLQQAGSVILGFLRFYSDTAWRNVI